MVGQGVALALRWPTWWHASPRSQGHRSTQTSTPPDAIGATASRAASRTDRSRHCHRSQGHATGPCSPATATASSQGHAAGPCSPATATQKSTPPDAIGAAAAQKSIIGAAAAQQGATRPGAHSRGTPGISSISCSCSCRCSCSRSHKSSISTAAAYPAHGHRAAVPHCCCCFSAGWPARCHIR